MALSTAQLTDLRGDIGDVNDPPAFSDEELQRLYTRAGENYDVAVEYAIRQLVANAAKFHDYTAGQTADQRSQIFDNLMRLLDTWQTNNRAKRGGQMKVVGLRAVPPVRRDKPGDPTE